MNIKITKLQPQNWLIYKNIRLEALQNESFAFGSSYEDNLKLPDEKWKERLKKSDKEDGQILLFAQNESGELVGMIGAYWDDGEKIRHIANIMSVYVSPKSRGMGVGKLLMDAILDKLSKLPQIEKIKLTVSSTQTTALKLYEKYGFKLIGTARKELKVGNQYIDEHLMERFKE